MNKLILCEGETDAVLLSYYLGKVAGWEYSKKGPNGLAIRATEQNESVNWYRKNGDFLLICSVGGKDNYKNFFTAKIQPPLLTTNAFAKIAIVTDRDYRKIEEIEASADSVLEVAHAAIKNNRWINCCYQDSYRMEKSFAALLVVIPNEHQGALETAMLEAIAENAYDRNIVEKTGVFADQMRTEAAQYISTDRLKLKAHLGLTWAVQYPEKVFTKIDEQIRNVPWESSEVLHTCFAELIEI